MLRRPTIRGWYAAALIALVSVTTAFAGDLEDGQAALEKQKYEKAAKAFLKALRTDEKNLDAAMGLAEAARGSGINRFLQDAAEALEIIREDKPEHVALLVSLANCYMDTAAATPNQQEASQIYVDAETTFLDAVKAGPIHEGANVGLARVLYMKGDFAAAAKAVDAFVDRKPDRIGTALFWKGESLFLEARDAYQSSGKMDDATRKLFNQAKGAYEASTKADSGNYKAWIQLAYSAAYVGDTGTAQDAYVQALAIDHAQEAPLKGLGTLMTHEKGKYGKLLDELVQKHPKHPYVLLYAAFYHYENKAFDKAAALLTRQVKEAKDPAAAWYYLGQIAEEQKRADDAITAYGKALKAAPHYTAAAAAYANVLLGGKSLRGIIMSATKADLVKLVKDHEKLFKLAPKDPWVRNNLGFILRDVYVAKNQSKEWLPTLKDSVRFYQAATDIIGEWDEGKRQTNPYWRRYQYAGVISDTALMYQFYAPTKDYDRAIKLYERALEYSDYAYLDSWNNLRKIYEELERWDDLFDLAEMCADGIADEAGKPDEARRAQARTVMKQLLESGKVKDQ